VPLRGFGAVAALYPADLGLYVKGGIYTIHSDDTGAMVNEFFNEPQYFRHLEIGWSATAGNGVPIQARGPMDANNVSVTLWNRDADPYAGTPYAHGVAFNANYLVQPNVMVFARGGWSEGWQLDRNVSFGVGWQPFADHADLAGVAAGWAQPANPTFRSQYVYEAFYRFQLTSQVAITPDLQYIQNPALNPGTNSLWVASVRARLAF
jgi:porin